MLSFQSGRDEAFEELVACYEGQVFSLLRRLLGPTYPLEDVAQEVFVRLFRTRDRYRPSGRLGTFLYRITYNLALNALRDRKRDRTSAALPRTPDGEAVELEDPRTEAPYEASDRDTWAGKIDAALQELPENQRSALVFQHYDGLDLAEIGEVLGISAKAVKSLLHRARENLRDILAPQRTAEHDR